MKTVFFHFLDDAAAAADLFFGEVDLFLPFAAVVFFCVVAAIVFEAADLPFAAGYAADLPFAAGYGAACFVLFLAFFKR